IRKLSCLSSYFNADYRMIIGFKELLYKVKTNNYLVLVFSIYYCNLGKHLVRILLIIVIILH
ncbi:hypothetical protein, partial [Halonatronum saccharophilum]|uniref:hypothetical protein n=1 Tax=Halonatronum saccharophilum TaxID=150060 RepID=UPI000554FBF2